MDKNKKPKQKSQNPISAADFDQNTQTQANDREEIKALKLEIKKLKKAKISALLAFAGLKEDLNHYLRASENMQLIVDLKLELRKFSPACASLLHLTASDIGLPIVKISDYLVYDDLIDDLKHVLFGAHNVEKTIKTKADKWFYLKIMPLTKKNKAPQGAVLTFADISKNLQKAEENTIEKLIQEKNILNAVIDTQEAERKRIGESLHNGLGQILYTVKLKLEGLSILNSPESFKQVHHETQALLLEAIKETRAISSELMPNILEDHGLGWAIEAICKKLRNTLKVNVVIKGLEKRLDSKFEIAIYRIVQELCNNVIKHAEATQVVIKIEHEAGKIHILVKDNGRGFNKEQQLAGLGISSIKSRVKLLGGLLKMGSKEKKGTEVQIDFQL